ncbi:camphor resistance protein CrcB [Aliiroseovarius halocynthiae]|uniref:Fluoride-specific ion channel FluC n=1 Tax=Aliiroseovarius halocynthiae TaxID=985055 RepID=A0A545SXS4_9RHOB|nr:fluoride efflux transporter CrcB [Aliiroseovarius halocynthiae]TQV69767.1 fluoride efflux transporter CrcB [Aliiroseovarius halocynthiae]SMR81773.1 camphor resistance protein CrcB [Aliiroseovarius halocynthiae]
MMTPLLQVALGGALGASARYLTGTTVTRLLGHGFPAGTMVVNIVGSFLMGVIVVALAKKGGQAAAPFLMTGLLGGFTTFSAFSLDAMTLLERGQPLAAMGYILGSVVISIVALMAGLWLTRMVLV